MPYQAWTALINAGQTNATTTGTALTNSIALTDVSPGANIAGQMLTLPANFAYPGQQFRFTANGIYSTTATPTLLLGLYYGTVSGTPLAVTAATTTASGVSNGTWVLQATSRVITTGTAGTIVTIGSVLGIAATSANPTLLPATSATGGQATINTSTANALTLGAQWGTAAAGNTLTVYNWAVELLN